MLLLAVAAVAGVVLMPRIRFRVHRWEVTDTAVHTREGWIGRQTRIAPISRVQTVDSRQGALQRMFGLGVDHRHHRLGRGSSRSTASTPTPHATSWRG